MEGEPLGQVDDYGPDRLFVYLRLEGASNGAGDALASALVQAGRPLVSLRLRDTYDLGAEFFRWEFATAVAGQMPGHQPLRPARRRVGEGAGTRCPGPLRGHPRAAAGGTRARQGALAVYGDSMPATSLAGYLAGYLAQALPGDYIALMAYIARSPANQVLLAKLRRAVNDRLRAIGSRISDPLRPAITVGFGPRFLHSTGQLHKGVRQQRTLHPTHPGGGR